MTKNTFTKPSFWSRRLILGTTVSGAVIFFIIGIIFWGGFNTAMEATNTTEFCIGCHEMEDNVYQEYKPTIHFANRTGVRAGCPDCHVPKPWIHKVVRKIQASKEVFSWLTGKLDTKEKFNEHRFELAQSVWHAMKSTDSRECRNCHNFESMNPEFQKPRARKQHLNAFETGQTCIDCHKGIAHNSVRDKLSDEALEKLEAPNPDYIREVPQAYRDGLARIEAKEAAAALKAKEEKMAEKEQTQQKISAAVEKALANAASSKTINASTSAAPVASKMNVDWAKASSKDIGVFYPGTASIEWVLGRRHGGKRAFTKGDRCIECHGKEIADIGKNIVTGESEKDLEPNVIPGKRGHIDVTIDSTHDAENLYLRFSWADGEHAAVPFVEGGKMDPENPMKLAFMLATDDVEYADRAGCWGTCHADANSMPFAPDIDTLKGSDLAKRLKFNTGSTTGVTKYLKESRTKLELKGRGGKSLGGWDKLKDQSEIDAAEAANQFMDVVRYKSGTKEVEDGQILAERDMHKGVGATVEASLKNGTWSVVVKRKLKSDNAGDVSIEAGKVYNFGFAIHDDYSSARYHHVSFGYKLALDNDEAEVNVTAQ
ncbi:MAG: nitrate/TMAO reductase-like tetraheme cytochrome c subunit [Colwellia sp.]|jgi:nitrate/TMAO reductase-like tetraheme cytochrome c subunit|tara:strand:- start:4048 stop:5844 length:1797 start_codon:yes stop_codon:yes gene_type:complete